MVDCPGKDLLSDMEENFQEYLLNPGLVRRMLLQLIDTVNFLHDQGAYNCGINPRNIIVSEDREKLYLFNLSSARRLWSGIEPNWRKRNSYHPWASGTSLSPTSGSLLKDIWGVRLVAILLSHPHLVQIWLLNDRHGSTLDRLEMAFDGASTLSDNLPISIEFEEFLLKALHPNPRL